MNTSPSIEVKGFSVDSLKNINTHFQKLLYTEREGLSLAVYHKNQLVLNLYGGFADKQSNRTWEENTMSCVYSVTKGFTSMLFANLVSEGKIKYDDLVTKYWKNFGKHNKESITILQVLDHEAGLISFKEDFGIDQANDFEYISRLIEDSTPHWTPGTKTGYHALTRGFILNEIYRRVTNKNTLGNFLKETVIPNLKHKEFYLGLPSIYEERVARTTNPHLIESIYEHSMFPLQYLKMMKIFFTNGMLSNVASNYPLFLSPMTTTHTFNQPKVRQLELPSANGVGTAKGVAETMSYIINSDLISNEVKAKIYKPLKNAVDIILLNKVERGHGFSYEKHPLNSKKYIINIVGNGGQVLDIDLEENLVISLVRNGLRARAQGYPLYQLMRTEIYKTLTK
uniref:Beta-lactamase domain-containing protein n=1 Tax=Rhabditophanes sp. KR3021 TaxID=114890 RepID=A0AC35U3K9_9BILA